MQKSSKKHIFLFAEQRIFSAGEKQLLKLKGIELKLFNTTGYGKVVIRLCVNEILRCSFVSFTESRSLVGSLDREIQNLQPAREEAKQAKDKAKTDGASKV